MDNYADMGDLVELLIFVAIIAVTLIIRAIKAAGEKSGGTPARAKSNSQMETWFEPDMNQLNQWGEFQPERGSREEQPSSFGSARPAAYQTRTGEPSRHPSEDAASKGTGGWEQYISSAERGKKQPDEAALAAKKGEYNTAQAMAVAFPRGRQMARRAAMGTDRRIVLSIEGREQLRRGVLLKEVLGQPRAFEL